ncbi:hypothetical protein D3C73_647940 [compost metagenome]
MFAIRQPVSFGQDADQLGMAERLDLDAWSRHVVHHKPECGIAVADHVDDIDQRCDE